MLIKGDAGSLEIIILRRNNTHSQDYWDANWLEAEIKIEVPGFKAHYGTSLRVDEFQSFYEDILRLQNHTSDRAEFTAMEEGLSLTCTLKKTGRIFCEGKADNLTGNRLEFTLDLDNSALNLLATGLQSILKQYPLIGKPY